MNLLKRSALTLLVASWCFNAQAEVELKIVTTDGFVAFTVQDQWSVLSMHTKPPVMAAAFQISNAADAGTPDSTDLAIRFFDLSSEAARASFQRVGETVDDSAPKLETFEGWTVYRQQAKQGPTVYSILDAKRELNGLSAAVRLAWPHLDGNSRDYREQMDQLFRSVLRSVRQHVGPYEPRDGEVIRRPTQ